jgi:SM-20-related protein
MTLQSPGGGPIPPHFLYSDFLSVDANSGLLDWVLGHEELLGPSTLGADNTVDLSKRRSRSLRLGLQMQPWRDMIIDRVTAAMPDLFGKAGMQPFEVSRFELELVVYEDGAHFHAHRDIVDIGKPAAEDRVLTGIYYFHAVPKGFSGGALRLFRFGVSEPTAGNYVDIEPEQNRFLIFPSWALHSVGTVRVPSGLFRDSRFAINVWLYRARTGKQAVA